MFLFKNCVVKIQYPFQSRKFYSQKRVKQHVKLGLFRNNCYLCQRITNILQENEYFSKKIHNHASGRIS
jgi:hypothetical protein